MIRAAILAAFCAAEVGFFYAEPNPVALGFAIFFGLMSALSAADELL